MKAIFGYGVIVAAASRHLYYSYRFTSVCFALICTLQALATIGSRGKYDDAK
jgi:hypothetical protein